MSEMQLHLRAKQKIHRDILRDFKKKRLTKDIDTNNESQCNKGF